MTSVLLENQQRIWWKKNTQTINLDKGRDAVLSSGSRKIRALMLGWVASVDVGNLDIILE
jgi:hypothetical protein